ncbi:MAG: Ni/Fe hydrogenase subunit alpha [Chloroflexi bacterium]|nr:Ni/Fe hydrogenase subunit alpha [Chloroflexota bacterium]
MSEKHIKVDYLARVEGEGALDIKVSDGKIEILKFSIFEPPRLFEAWLQGRSYRELPDFVARICGICPVAYQMSAIHAAEDAFGIRVEGQVRTLRRLFYCGEWLESHLLHIYMLAAPDFLGYESAIAMAKDYPEVLKRGLRMKRLGNDIVAMLAGREIHPISACVGGFYAAPPEETLRTLIPRLEQGTEDARETIRWTASLDLPDLTRDIEFVSLSHPDEYPMNEGRIVSSKGVDVSIHDYTKAFEEYQVDYTTALRSRVRERGSYFVGPLARVNLNFDKLTPATRKAALACGIGFPNSNPFTSIVARAVEVMHAMDEALRIVRDYRRPPEPYVEARPRAGTGHGATEAPRGLLYHDYDFDDEGLIRRARIVPPTAQNQAHIEDDLREWVPRVIHLPLEEATIKAEMAVRNYDPCISCATHLLKLRVKGGDGG